MNVHQAQALAQTGRGAVDYTRGVLAAIGYAAMADELRKLTAAHARALEDLDRADRRTSTHAPEPATPEYVRARAYLEDVIQRENAVWAKVDALVEQARDVLGAHVPPGMAHAS